MTADAETLTITAPIVEDRAADAKTAAAPEPGDDRRPAGAAVKIANPPATPQALFDRAVAAIARRYEVGTLARLDIERPDLAAEIERAMNRVEITWRESEPIATPAFRLALRTWYDLNILAIDYLRGLN